MYSDLLPPCYFPQHLIEIMEKVPDYAEVFNGNPRAGYLVLVFVALLSTLGWYRLPHPSGLRHLMSSNLAVSILIIFTRYRRLVHEPPEAIASIVVILGLLNLILITKDNDQIASSVSAFNFISGWCVSIAYPGIKQVLQHAFKHTPSGNLSIYALNGVEFSFILAMTLGSLIWTNSGRRGIERQVSIKRVAELVLFDTVFLILGELGLLISLKNTLGNIASAVAS